VVFSVVFLSLTFVLVCLKEFQHNVYFTFVVRSEILYNILITSGNPKNVLRLIKFCLTKSYKTVSAHKNFSDTYPNNPLAAEFSFKF
jgi:ABC-type Fe3+ transport system substrate-binding protein